ncbi:hypothetical protein AGMMS4957_05420 [Bacteroidia bacterium]|nr:hypothetical protein AGMMS4957_05420 [Bacteroidia bacterium]
MEKVFENIVELMNQEDYDKALAYVINLINEATANGALDEQDADNEYTREISRVGGLCADYENAKMQFQTITVHGRSPFRSSTRKLYRKLNTEPKRILEYA